jgi:predicted transcriptional regulator
MDAAKKLEILDWVMHLTDETVFNKLLDIKNDARNKDEVVAYTVLGEPLNLEQYKAKAEEGINDIREGRITSHDDLLDEIKSW